MYSAEQSGRGQSPTHGPERGCQPATFPKKCLPQKPPPIWPARNGPLAGQGKLAAAFGDGLWLTATGRAVGRIKPKEKMSGRRRAGHRPVEPRPVAWTAVIRGSPPDTQRRILAPVRRRSTGFFLNGRPDRQSALWPPRRWLTLHFRGPRRGDVLRLAIRAVLHHTHRRARCHCRRHQSRKLCLRQLHPVPEPGFDMAPGKHRPLRLHHLQNMRRVLLQIPRVGLCHLRAPLRFARGFAMPSRMIGHMPIIAGRLQVNPPRMV